MKATLLLILVTGSVTLGQPVKFIPLPVTVKSSFRAMSVPDDRVVWVSGSKGWIGRSTDGGDHWKFFRIGKDSTADYRTLFAQDSMHALVGNTGSPALIHRTDDGGASWSVVYSNNHPDAFLDGAGFWDDSRGIIYGDPIDGKLLLIGTSDGGRSWTPYPDDSRPEVIKGEASFAASQTNIRCNGKGDVWIATGGSRASLFHSADQGRNWTRTDTPMASGKPGAGTFSICLVGSDNIALAGGDYQSALDKTGNYCIGNRPGRNWKVKMERPAGYRSIIESTPEGLLIASGPDGSDLSLDGGKRWKPVPGAPNINVISRSRNGKLMIAGGRNGLWRIEEAGRRK